jgi:2-keto-4-pentenoate hydratase/2-oxohepta-3-ene-1,7-dioic acid hydratase in catechol pathway
MSVNRWIVAGFAAAVLATASTALAQAQVRYVKYEVDGRASWGILENNDTTIRELQGNPFDGSAKPTGKTVKPAEVKYLPPAEPKKVIAAGLNYKSHIGQASPAKYVGLFAKFPTTLTGHEQPIGRRTSPRPR